MTTNSSPSLIGVLSRLPKVVLWIWLNVLIFDIANQRLPGAVVEDTVNKQFRPLPSRRISATHARRLLLAVIPLVVVANAYLGGAEETIIAIGLTWMYNDLGGSEENWIVRNLINSGGFMSYSAGTAKVATGYDRHKLNDMAYGWLAVVGIIVLSTLQIQDMADMEGDAACGRKTMPLKCGETLTRWSIAVAVAVWSIVCPWMFDLAGPGYAIPTLLGSMIVVRILACRNVDSDKGTFKLWCLWTACIYMLPLIKNPKVFDWS